MSIRFRRGGCMAFAFAASLSAQNYFGQRMDQRMTDLQQQRNTLTLSETFTPGERRIKPQVRLDELVGVLPSFVPAGVVWQVTGMEPSGIQPLLAKDAVFITTLNRLKCLDLADGRERWSFPLKDAPAMQTVMLEGRILAGTEGGELVCLDSATGKALWRASLKSAKGGKLGEEEIQPISQPVLHQGRLYLGTFASGLFKTAGRLYAFDLATGGRIWECEVPGGVAHPPVVSNELVWAGGCERMAAHRLADGQLVKEFGIRKGALSIPVAGPHGIYFCAGGEAYRIDPVLPALSPLPAVGAGAGLAAEGDRLVANAGTLAVHELPSGKDGWRSPDKLFAPPVLRRGQVFAATSARTIKVFELAGGKQIGNLELAADLGYPRPLVGSEQALVCERTAANGVLLEAFRGPAWKPTWRLEIQEAIAALPQFTPKGMLLWTASGYLRLIR